MTRENKLALVVGFGLVLFVGILVSDHYSVIHRKPGSDLVDPDLVAATPVAREVGLRDMREGTMAAATAGNRGAAPQSEVASAPPPAPLGPGVSVPPPPPEEMPQRIVIGPSGDESEARPVDPLSRPASSAVVHVVKPGETLFAIARIHYGDGGHWKRILEANGLRDAKSLRAGDRLRIPDAAAGAVPVGLVRNDAPARDDGPSFRDYTVQEGDTLSKIARQLMGSRADWQELYKLNKDRIPNPDRVKPGTVIRVPTARAGRGEVRA